MRGEPARAALARPAPAPAAPAQQPLSATEEALVTCRAPLAPRGTAHPGFWALSLGRPGTLSCVGAALFLPAWSPSALDFTLTAAPRPGLASPFHTQVAGPLRTHQRPHPQHVQL